MAEARSRLAVALLDGKLYAAGGRGHDGRISSVERYDPVTNAWEAVAPMTTVRMTLAAAALDGKLYAVGGHNGASSLSSVERYDPTTNVWEAVVAPMAPVRMDGFAVSLM